MNNYIIKNLRTGRFNTSLLLILFIGFDVRGFVTGDLWMGVLGLFVASFLISDILNHTSIIKILEA